MTENAYATVNFKGFEFVIGKSKKFDKDFYKVTEILSKEELNEIDRIDLINIYQASYHETGKIAGIMSHDGSCKNCTFCQKMQEAAKNDISHICHYCYDRDLEAFRIDMMNRHSLNLLIMSSVEFTNDELKRIPVSSLNRTNSSGDTQNYTHASNMIRLAIINKFARFGYWAKNASPIIEACDKFGKPENLVLVYSGVIIGKTPKLPKYFDYTFTVYPDKKSTQEAIKNGSCECNGLKCRECGYKCYFGTWKKGSNIAELLRGINKEDRKKLVTYIENGYKK